MEDHSDTEPTEIAESDAENEEEEEDGRWSQALIVEWSAMLRHPFFVDAETALARLSDRASESYYMRKRRVLDPAKYEWRARTLPIHSVMVGYALRMGWADIAAELAAAETPTNPTDANGEPTEKLFDESRKDRLYAEGWRCARPFLQLAWTFAAYFAWRDNDRAFLRGLCEEGVLSTQHVVDMLFIASCEEAAIPVTQATAAVLIGEGETESTNPSWRRKWLERARAVARTTAPEDSDQRMFRCPRRCEAMRELMTMYSVVLSLDWDTADAIVGNATMHLNLFMLQFLASVEGTEVILDGQSLNPLAHLPENKHFLWARLALARRPYNTNRCFYSWKSFTTDQILGPSGLLATIARELHLVEFVAFWLPAIETATLRRGLDWDTFIRDEYEYSPFVSNIRRNLCSEVGCAALEDSYRRRAFDCVGGHLAFDFALRDRLIDLYASLRPNEGALTARERRALADAFDYDFTKWDRRAFLAEVLSGPNAGERAQQLLDECARRCCDVVVAAEEATEEQDHVTKLWEDATKEEPDFLPYLFDPHAVAARLESRKRKSVG